MVSVEVKHEQKSELRRYVKVEVAALGYPCTK